MNLTNIKVLLSANLAKSSVPQGSINIRFRQVLSQPLLQLPRGIPHRFMGTISHLIKSGQDKIIMIFILVNVGLLSQCMVLL